MALFGLLRWDLLALIIILLFVFNLYVRKCYDYFKDRGIPFVKPIWLLGNNFKVVLGMEGLEENLDYIYKQLKSYGMGGYYQFLSPSFIICDPKLIEKVIIKDFSHFHDHGFHIDPEVNPIDEHLFNMSGTRWKLLRSKLSPIFTSGKLKLMHPEIVKVGDRLVEYLEDKANGEDYAIREVCANYGLDVLTACAFGIQTDALHEEANLFKVMTYKFLKPTPYRLAITFLRFFLPTLFLKLKMRSISKEVNDFFIDVTKKCIEQRKSGGEKRNDFLQLLLQLKETGSVDVDPKDKDEREALEAQDHVQTDEKLEYTDGLLAAQCFIFFGAGFEPAATVMSYALYLLSKHPDIQTEVRNLIRKQEAKHGGLTYDALRECELLEDCISETLRLYAPNIGLFRECTKTYTFENGYKIEKGTTVMIPTCSLHMDEDFFPEPLAFKPSRFANGCKPTPGSYLPFGDGPRICIARRFALLQAKVGLAKVLANYEILPSTKNIEPLRRNIKSFTVEPIGGLWVRLKKASKE